MTHKVAWTPEMDAALIAARAQGLGGNRIGEIVGVSCLLVLNRVRELGMPEFKWPRYFEVEWTPEMDSVLREMRLQGSSTTLIGEVIGVSAPTVMKRVRALGLPERVSRKAVMQ